VVNDPNVPPNLCFPGKEEVAAKVAEITGKKMASVENVTAAIRCSRQDGNVKQELEYIGYNTCAAAALAYGGQWACKFACLGFGDCVSACPFDAMTLVNGMPEVDPVACVGCGTCVRTCPKGIIELIPSQARVWVPCSNKDAAKAVKAVCEVGCISCRMCVKVCPAKAVTLEDGIIKIDHKKCVEYGPECKEVCVEKCPQKIFRYYRPSTAVTEQKKAEAA